LVLLVDERLPRQEFAGGDRHTVRSSHPARAAKREGDETDERKTHPHDEYSNHSAIALFCA
jgi:hypothetical protein